MPDRDDLIDEAIRATSVAVLLGADADLLLDRLRAAIHFGMESRSSMVLAGEAMGRIDTGPEPDSDATARADDDEQESVMS